MSSAIRRALGLLDHVLALGNAGPFITEAAIAAVHRRSRTASDTDWPEIAALTRYSKDSARRLLSA